MSSLADRVRETTTTVGNGTVNLAGAVGGYQAFSAAFVSGTDIFYCITDGTNWEVGHGALTSGAPWTLARTVVLSSSNSGALVSFGAGAKDVFCTMPASPIKELTGGGVTALHSHTPASTPNTITTSVSIPADTSYIVMGDLTVLGDLTIDGNLGVI
jgi:hypothetical protein